MPIEEYSIPPALKSTYLLKEPNQPIQLYEGTLEVLQEGGSRGNGAIYLKWFPFPQIEFQLTCDSSTRLDVAQASSVKFSKIDKPVKALIAINARSNLTERSIYITGRVREPIIIGLGQSLSYIQFHLTNFEDFYGTAPALIEDNEGLFIAQRAIFEAGGWRVTIDQLKSTTADIKILKSQGGYAVTHVGKLEKASGEVFTADDGRIALRALSDFLSFVKGLRVVPILLVGFDSEDNPIWQEWIEAKTASPWQNVNSWAWGVTATNLAKAFPGFWDWWQSWSDSARRIIYWYVESNTQAGAIEGSCVLEHATLELIAWNLFEQDFESSGNKLNSVSKKINHLLKAYGIPQEIPSELNALKHLSEELSKRSDKNQALKNNGPWIFTEVRNSITHSAPKNREILQNSPVDVRVEAWELGLWYLELILLRLFDYQRSYFNRLRRGIRYFGDLDLTPWLVPRIDQYIRAAMSHAAYEVLESDNSFSGKISEFENLQANAESLEACQQKLEKALKEGIMVELHRGSSLPVINGINLNYTRGDVV